MDYLERIKQRCIKQESKGLKKYGIPLSDNNDLSVEERLEYLAEELTDALYYIECLKDKLNK